MEISGAMNFTDVEAYLVVGFRRLARPGMLRESRVEFLTAVIGLE